MTEATAPDGSHALQFVRPSASDQEQDELSNLFQDALQGTEKIVGLTSAIDGWGADWLQEFLDQRSDPHVLVVLAVLGGGRTRRDDLVRLLDLQNRAGRDRVQFRILPMQGGSGTPANCLVALPAAGTPPIFLVGPTPNFGIDKVSHTQINLCFQAELELFEQWRLWFDAIWQRAAPLTTATVDIPALVPATGTIGAAEKWQSYCNLCRQFVEGRDEQIPGDDSVPSEAGSGEDEAGSGEGEAGSENLPSTPTTIAKLPKLDRLENRISRLFKAGQQVTIARTSAVRPLRVPIDPRLLRQEAQIRDGTVVQKQSFSISAFSDEELKKIDAFRRGSRTILEKLGLPLATAVYWLPNQAIDIFQREWQSKNEEAQEMLNQIVGRNADNFVDSKIGSIQDDLDRVFERLGGVGEVPRSALTEVVSDLKRRISHAIEGQLATPVTYSEVRFLPQEESDERAPWAQAEKLILALARFPRSVMAHPKRTISGLITPDVEILTAMDVENDAIVRHWSERRFEAAGQARWEEGMLDRISGAEIASRDRCMATLMLIDGQSLAKIDSFIIEKAEANDPDSPTQNGDTP